MQLLSATHWNLSCNRCRCGWRIHRCRSRCKIRLYYGRPESKDGDAERTRLRQRKEAGLWGWSCILRCTGTQNRPACRRRCGRTGWWARIRWRLRRKKTKQNTKNRLKAFGENKFVDILHLFSSLKSPQSLRPSHKSAELTQRRFAQRNWPARHSPLVVLVLEDMAAEICEFIIILLKISN